MKTVKFPKLPVGRPSKEVKTEYENVLVPAFVNMMKEVQSTLDFKMGGRAWCYYLETNLRAINKNDFDAAQMKINEWRKEGLFPPDFILLDGKREYECKETDINWNSPKDHAEGILNGIRYQHRYYKPFSFWDAQEFFLIMWVEKESLKSLFHGLCEKYSIPLASVGGWYDINQRIDAASMYQEQEAEGRKPILLYAGDFDPKGFEISQFIKKNFEDVMGATNWDPDNLQIDRFALNYEYILEHKPTRINNLWTSKSGRGNTSDIPARDKYPLENPKHPDHNKSYVQDYLN